MKKIHKKIFIVALCFAFLFPLISFAAAQCASRGYCVNLDGYGAIAQAQVPGLEFLNIPQGASIGDVLIAVYKFALGLVGISALIMIVWGGILYMSARDNKGQMDTAKGYIWNAIYGLVLALLSWLILFTINPDLVEKLNLDFSTAKITPAKQPKLGEIFFGDDAKRVLTKEELQNQQKSLPPGSQPFAVPNINTGANLPPETFPLSQASNQPDPQKVNDCTAAGRKVDRAPTTMLGSRGCITFCLRSGEEPRNSFCLD